MLLFLHFKGEYYEKRYYRNLDEEKSMSKELVYFLDGVYSAFSISGKGTKISKRAKQAKSYSAHVSTDTKQNFRKSIGRISSSIKRATA